MGAAPPLSTKRSSLSSKIVQTTQSDWTRGIPWVLIQSTTAPGHLNTPPPFFPNHFRLVSDQIRHYSEKAALGSTVATVRVRSEPHKLISYNRSHHDNTYVNCWGITWWHLKTNFHSSYFIIRYHTDFEDSEMLSWETFASSVLSTNDNLFFWSHESTDLRECKNVGENVKTCVTTRCPKATFETCYDWSRTKLKFSKSDWHTHMVQSGVEAFLHCSLDPTWMKNSAHASQSAIKPRVKQHRRVTQEKVTKQDKGSKKARHKVLCIFGQIWKRSLYYDASCYQFAAS